MAATVAALASAAASASETVTYTYDAKGRLVTVSHSGSANNGLTAAYAFDKADNRINVTVAGAPRSPRSPGVVVVPLAGFTIIPVS